jgi:hypothetical protein
MSATIIGGNSSAPALRRANPGLSNENFNEENGKWLAELRAILEKNLGTSV